jgi:hypothetical protein
MRVDLEKLSLAIWRHIHSKGCSAQRCAEFNDNVPERPGCAVCRGEMHRIVERHKEET